MTLSKAAAARPCLVFPGGIDKQYRREFYPVSFSLSWSSLVKVQLQLMGLYMVPETVGVLTARARSSSLPWNSSKKASCAEIRDCGVKNGFHNWVSAVRYGSAQEWVVNSWKGLRKFENFELMMEDYALERTVSGTSISLWVIQAREMNKQENSLLRNILAISVQSFSTLCR